MASWIAKLDLLARVTCRSFAGRNKALLDWPDLPHGLRGVSGQLYSSLTVPWTDLRCTEQHLSTFPLSAAPSIKCSSNLTGKSSRDFWAWGRNVQPTACRDYSRFSATRIDKGALICASDLTSCADKVLWEHAFSQVLTRHNVRSASGRTKGGETEDYARGLLKPLREGTNGSNAASVVPGGGWSYEVCRVSKDGGMRMETLKAADLGLHPRDMDILEFASLTPHRATITLRGSMLLVRMEYQRALVSPDYILLFGTRPSEAPNALASEISRLLHRRPQEKAHSSFQLRMLECILRETSYVFLQKVERLKLLAECMVEEMTEDWTRAGPHHRLLPLKRALTEVEHDITEAHEAVAEAMADDNLLAAVGNSGTSAVASASKSHEDTPEGSPQQAFAEALPAPPLDPVKKRAAVDMLAQYQREVQDVGAVLQELREHMDSAQEVWELSLDSTRNNIIRINLYLSIATLSLALSTVPASFFGMNLISGLEDHPVAFNVVTAACVAASTAACAGFIWYYNRGPRVKHKKRIEEQAALREVLHHIDSLDEIISTASQHGRDMSKDDFRRFLSKHPKTSMMKAPEADLIFRIYDANRDGLLEKDEHAASLRRHMRTEAPYML